MARRTKAEAEATREAILDAAEEVFMARGVADSSLEEIARKASVTRGAVYWHFHNKSDVFDAMLDRVRLPMTEMLEAAANSSPGHPAGLRDVCIYALNKLADDQRHFRVYTILFHRTESDSGLKMQTELAQDAMTQCTNYFDNGGGAASLHPELTPRQAARSLHTQMLGIYYDWLRDPTAWNLKAEAVGMVDTIFRGLCVNHQTTANSGQTISSTSTPKE